MCILHMLLSYNWQLERNIWRVRKKLWTWCAHTWLRIRSLFFHIRCSFQQRETFYYERIWKQTRVSWQMWKRKKNLTIRVRFSRSSGGGVLSPKTHKGGPKRLSRHKERTTLFDQIHLPFLLCTWRRSSAKSPKRFSWSTTDTANSSFNRFSAIYRQVTTLSGRNKNSRYLFPRSVQKTLHWPQTKPPSTTPIVTIGLSLNNGTRGG